MASKSCTHCQVIERRGECVSVILYINLCFVFFDRLCLSIPDGGSGVSHRCCRVQQFHRLHEQDIPGYDNQFSCVVSLSVRGPQCDPPRGYNASVLVGMESLNADSEQCAPIVFAVQPVQTDRRIKAVFVHQRIQNIFMLLCNCFCGALKQVQHYVLCAATVLNKLFVFVPGSNPLIQSAVNVQLEPRGGS